MMLEDRLKRGRQREEFTYAHNSLSPKLNKKAILFISLILVTKIRHGPTRVGPIISCLESS